jgi:sugar O-acyltransferase (sialic acid O-acetyltransferase NeuD family)
MDVVLIGAGGHGKVVLDILRAQGQHRAVGFLDADPAITGTRIGDLPVLGQINHLPKLAKQKIKGAIVSIGDNRVRLSYARMVMEHGLELINAIHPAAVVSSSARLGKNIVIAAGAVINPEASIADSVIINTAAIIEHECEIAWGVHVCPGAALAGRVRVGAGAFIGLGSRIIQCLTIGEEATIGAGAVVLQDIPPGATAVGVPAKVIKSS